MFLNKRQIPPHHDFLQHPTGKVVVRSSLQFWPASTSCTAIDRKSQLIALCPSSNSGITKRWDGWICSVPFWTKQSSVLLSLSVSQLWRRVLAHCWLEKCHFNTALWVRRAGPDEPTRERREKKNKASVTVICLPIFLGRTCPPQRPL